MKAKNMATMAVVIVALGASVSACEYEEMGDVSMRRNIIGENSVNAAVIGTGIALDEEDNRAVAMREGRIGFVFHRNDISWERALQMVAYEEAQVAGKPYEAEFKAWVAQRMLHRYLSDGPIPPERMDMAKTYAQRLLACHTVRSKELLRTVQALKGVWTAEDHRYALERLRVHQQNLVRREARRTRALQAAAQRGLSPKKPSALDEAVAREEAEADAMLARIVRGG